MALPNPFARRRTPPPDLVLEPHPDDLPKTGLFTEPVRVTDLQVLDPETLDDGRHRVTFLIEVRDADGKRCSDLSVEARVRGPERTRTVQGTTDMFGRIRFRMASTAGDYAIEVTDVAAQGLAWDRAAGTTEASTTVG
ncbi:hypothetical protein [Nitriliruptor alkaliphilus]|uniref:hypothetical protein n=1 Tax=Nitriliruptor alkaliphilus TaxID=427918 RepID=UPI0006990310|nr:hypothetical protein [Nitriliruptor alkaliphilus]